MQDPIPDRRLVNAPQFRIVNPKAKIGTVPVILKAQFVVERKNVLLQPPLKARHVRFK